MKFSISSVVGLLPLAMALPTDGGSGKKPQCSEISQSPEFRWTVEQFDFHASYIFSTPAHQNSWGYASFNLTNPALPYQAACSASSNQLNDFFYGNMWYNCSLPAEANGNGPAAFQYSRPSGKLDVNQTWECNDLKDPTNYKAAGTTNLTLDCQETKWQNPNWTVGQIYSTRDIKCAPVNVPIKPFELTGVA